MRLLHIVLIFLLTVLSYSQTNNTSDKNYLHDYLIADKLFRDAEKLASQEYYSQKKEEDMNMQALFMFKKLIPILNKTGNDSLAFFCHFKMALIRDYYDSLPLAKESYLAAINIKNKTPAIADSFLFQPLLFSGRIFYSLNEFDSAYAYYKKAEKVSENYQKPLINQQRLYNGLGSMYFETGNYKQAKNYFEKASLLLSPSDPGYTDFLINYKSNIASSLVQLEKYTTADSIYRSILPFNILTNETLLSLGNVNLRLGNAQKAVGYLKKVQYSSKLNIALYNQLGKAYWKLFESDSANKYFSLALAENNKWNGSIKNIQHGITYQYIGDKYAAENKNKEAVENYQQAIIQFYPDFNQLDINANPQKFTSIFSYINLFNTLTAKADAFEQLYKKEKKQSFLEAALNSYRSAFTLAGYVERTYESDEARLFLNKIKYNVHDHPINISLQLYELTKNKMYLEEAYNFDQQNKASILALNVQESSLKKQPGFNSDLFEKEGAVKSTITRLSLKAARITDSGQLEKINSAIRDNEIELGKLQEKMNELPGFKAQKFAQSIPTVAKVQKLIDAKTALLSYHLSKHEMVILCITANGINYFKTDIGTDFYYAINIFKNKLSEFKTEKLFDDEAVSLKLYDAIIKPALNKITNATKLLIIPDDELNNLPFEALRGANGKYLLENFVIQYQYSTALLRDDVKKNGVNTGALAMAPFSNNAKNNFAKLEYSKNEVRDISGNILLDSAATKKQFLAAAHKYGILHLATHTIVNDTFPEQTVIAFYQDANFSPTDNNLSVGEIYNLKLDSTKLVILSACETGTGKLAKGEGLMSLSRAFTYAGCPNIIASLWKADDKSTAWIIHRFYHYQQNGTPAAAALQKAKIDYLQSPDIEKRFKTPNYWAHLILTSIPEKERGISLWIWFATGMASLIFLLFYLFKYRKANFSA